MLTNAPGLVSSLPSQTLTPSLLSVHPRTSTGKNKRKTKAQRDELTGGPVSSRPNSRTLSPSATPPSPALASLVASQPATAEVSSFPPAHQTKSCNTCATAYPTMSRFSASRSACPHSATSFAATTTSPLSTPIWSARPRRSLPMFWVSRFSDRQSPTTSLSVPT